MKRFSWMTLLAAGLVSGVAFAQGTSGYDRLFAEAPCPDGWAGCRVDGAELSPEPVLDSAGRPMPSDLRVQWFDLQAGPTFDPFVGLSAYDMNAQPAVADAAEDPPAVEDDPVEDDPMAALLEDDPEPPVADDPGTQDVVADADPDPRDDRGYDPGPTKRDDPDPVATRRDDPEPVATKRDDPEPVATKRDDPEPVATKRDDPPPVEVKDDGAEERARLAREAEAAEAARIAEDARLAEASRLAEEEAAAAAALAATEPPPAAAGCDDLQGLEPEALMGMLGADTKKCLERRYSGASKQTEKDKVSRVLLANAEASGDKREWERLMKRHLEEVDRSDPNLCFKYAKHLSRGGVGRAWGVIKWADYALENKQQWSGTTYKTRVYALYQMRAEAAVKLWEQSNNDLIDAGDNRDELSAKEEKLRGMAKDYSREWLDYARASGQDIKKPMALCVSASGSKKHCQE